MLDVAVLGGGVIGCAVARELARAGLRVALFERGRIGGEASGAAAGMLGVQGETDDELMLRLGLESRRLYPGAARRRCARRAAWRWSSGATGRSRSPSTAPMRRCSSAAGVAAGGRRRQRGADAAPDLGARAGGQPAASAPACCSRSTARLDSVALTQALARAAAAAGCALREGEDVKSVVAEHGRIAGIATASGRVACDAVVNAMGAWAGRVRGTTALPVRPVRGQIAVVQAPRPPFRHAVYSPRALRRRAARRPRPARQHARGGRLRQARHRRRDRHHPRRGALELSPDARHAAARPMRGPGLRPGSADGRPIVGADPAVQGYYVASGHYRNGVLLAPLTARLVAASLRGERSPWHDALGIERFAAARRRAR